ncbi:hypothetical protein N7470_005250 [Penicillium chermesinum]|nr:hypothetical protein N7470_005250 [Penicillium chermesinum]
MKEPFQLRLPSSPVSCDSAPTFPPPRSQREAKPPGGHTLRTWRSDQNLTSANMAALGLLPSPSMTESRPASTGPESTFLKRSKVPSDEKEVVTPEMVEEITKSVNHSGSTDNIKKQDRTPEIPSESSGYEEVTLESQKRPTPPVTNVQEAHSNLIRHCEANELETAANFQENDASPRSPTSVPSPRRHLPGNSPRPQRPRTATVSSEASWISSNLAYCETWLKGVPLDPMIGKSPNDKEHNRRKIQIVEQDPPHAKIRVKTLQAPVVSTIPSVNLIQDIPNPLLKRFAVASKPKLVDIAPHSSPSLPALPPASINPHPLPMTPDQRQEEVSAFSPDTPLDMSDSGYGTRESGYSLSSYPESKDEDSYSDPGSLTSDSVTSTVVGERPDTAQGERTKSPRPEIRSGSVSPQALSPAKSSSGRRSPLSDKEAPERSKLMDHKWTLDDHEWTLDELDHFVKDFPRNMLRLTSPVILFLRRSDEKDFLRPFRTIFPNVSENILDGLCAAFIARNYLFSLSNLHRHKPTLSSRTDTYALDAIPTKAYSTLGIQIPHSSLVVRRTEVSVLAAAICVGKLKKLLTIFYSPSAAGLMIPSNLPSKFLHKFSKYMPANPLFTSPISLLLSSISLF